MHKTLGIITGVSLLILISWFSWRLYQITSQPALKLENKTYSVVNCEQPRDEHASMICPYLHCNKALLESGEIPENARISRSTNTPPSASGTTRIDGLISYSTTENKPIQKRFECNMLGDKLIDYHILAVE